MVGALGWALLCLLLAACHLKKKTLFGKNFLDLSVDGRRTGPCTTVPPAGYLPSEEEKLFEKNFLDLSEDGRRTGTPTMPILCAVCHPKKKTLFGKNFLDLSVDGRCTMPAAG